MVITYVKEEFSPLNAKADYLGDLESDADINVCREGWVMQTNHGRFILINDYVPNEGEKTKWASFSANSFVELIFSRPLLRACESLGYKKPTPIQATCIPLALTGRDICGSAITGSGKTAAFSLPALERLLYRPRCIPTIRVLILTLTSELVVQVHSMADNIAKFTDIHSCLLVGGLSTKTLESTLRSRPDIVVASLGRMIDHFHNAKSVGLEELTILILNEAERLLDLGFSSEVQGLVKICQKKDKPCCSQLQ